MIPPNPETQAAPGAAGAAVELNEFESLLNKEFKARDVQKQSAVQTAVRTLAEQALSATKLVSNDAIKTIEEAKDQPSLPSVGNSFPNTEPKSKAS